LYDIVEYDNGVDALAGMRARAPDLVLLDISLPGMDGMEVLEQMKRDDRLRLLPVIALTAHAAKSDRERFLAAGFTDYLTKPIIDEALLVESIAKLLAS
jgi:CheY-like chemotaxis protein